MIKLLLTPAVFLAALQQEDEAAVNLLKRCREDDTVQAWVLSSTIQNLIDLDITPVKIKEGLSGVSQIPVNARLTNEAMEAGGDFKTALNFAAAKMFKLNAIVGFDSDHSKEVPYFSVDEAVDFKEDYDAKNVDFLDLKAPLHTIFDQVDGWYMEIIQNTAFAGGNHVKAFEEEFAKYCNAKLAIGVNSGTDALRFALYALGVRPGDEVITVPNTFIATTEAISQVGATPVFVDVLPDTYNMDPAKIEEKITDKTKVILPVHLYGQIADMDPIMEIANKHGLKVLEDSAQAHGAEYKGRRAGTFGHAAAFSMYPGKNLGAFGEAGCVVTNDQEVADTVSCLRDHGQRKKYYHKMEGFNGRLDNLQAASLRAKLPHMDKWNAKRRKNAELYAKYLANIPQLKLPAVPAESSPVFHLYVVLAENSEKLHSYMAEQGVFSGFHYPIPLHEQEAYAEMGYKTGDFPVTENAARKLLSLPMFPELAEEQIERIAKTIEKFYE